VGLNETEQDLLSFGVLLHISSELEEISDILGSVSFHVASNILAVVLQQNRAKIRKALARDSLLHRTGLLRIDRDGRNQMIYQITVMNEISDVLLDEDQPDIMKALTRFFIPSPAAKLQVSDFSHIQKDYTVLRRYLASAGEKRQKGVNILVFGPPGTGKTEMVRTLAEQLNKTLYEVTTGYTEDETYEDERSRVDSYRLCQYVLKRKKDTLILFDEIEDTFIRDGSMERFGIRTSTDARKGSFNHLLESNPLPAIWVSNVISHIDEAIIRRFDYVMELKIPPRSTRMNIIKQHTQALDISEQWIEQVSVNEALAPALISRAVKVCKELDSKDQAQTETHLSRILSNTLSAMGYDKNLSNRHSSPISYRLDALNPDYDLKMLQQALASKTTSGRFCLYGPSGTGKSEFARHLAKVLDKPLLIKRASDLLDPYIGMTEKNISNMFQQAEEEESLLLLDEADSFLRDRSRSRESWEVTQVNELLTQMEQFKGLFFCTTNLMETLDQASLRRFDLKIKFDYLNAEQVWTLFQQTLEDFQQPVDDLNTWQPKVRALQGVTPGDFATVARQNQFSAHTLDAQGLIKGLEREIKFKQYGAFKGMGFLQS
jgi:SpoVK/Ycf46/Vps4 family AAA+-type ATPase